MVRNDVWALTGLAYADGVLCLDCLSHRLGRPLRLDDFPMEGPLNREGWAAIWRAVTASDSRRVGCAPWTPSHEAARSRL